MQAQYNTLYAILSLTSIRGKPYAGRGRVPALPQRVHSGKILEYASPETSYTAIIFETDDPIKGAMPKDVYRWLMAVASIRSTGNVGPHSIMFWHGQRSINGHMMCDLDIINGKLYNGLKTIPWAATSNGIYALAPFRRYVNLDQHFLSVRCKESV